MKNTTAMRVFSLLLALVMVVGMIPATTFATENSDETTATTAPAETEVVETEAAEETEAQETEAAEETEAEVTEEATEAAQDEESVEVSDSDEAEALEAVTDSIYDTAVSKDYFNVISQKDYQLAPGATEYEIVLNNDAGNDRKVAHIIEVDPKSESVEILPGYYEIDKFNPDDMTTWKTAGVTGVAAYYANTLGYNVVGAMNTALQYTNNAPYGFMVYNGEVLANNDLAKGAQTYLAVIKKDDGTVEFDLRSISEPLTGNEWQAVSTNFGWLVSDGKLSSTSVERTSSDASRSMLGIKADGSLVICQVDGRNAPVSSGLSNYEMGEMMLALGCVWAVNGDGGGSSSFVSKRPGSSELVMRSIPSDGAERPTINSIIVVSKVKEASGVFASAVLSAEAEYIAPGATMTINTAGVDTNGFPIDTPADVTWTASSGTITDKGVFTAGSELGEVTISLSYNGAVAGEMTLNVVHPDKFGFAEAETVLPYGKSMELAVDATYGEDDWTVCINGAYTVALSDDTAATLDGYTLTATTDETKKSVVVTATYIPDNAKTSTVTVNFGKGSEIIFDFEDGDISKFMGVDEMYDWAAANGASAPIQSNSNYSDNADSETFLAMTSNGGQVKNGNHALGVTLDYTDAEFAGWSYNMFFYTGDEEIVLRDVANGKNATTFGMWVYIPEGAAGLAMQMQGYQNPNGTGGTGGHFYFTTASGAVKNLNSCSEADIPAARWVYATCDLTQFGDFFATYDPYGTNGREPSFIRFYVKPTTPANLTFYFDDFTLDYSSAVEDRVLPTISNVSYTPADEAIALENGAVINGSTIAFSAKVADNLGLNPATGVILLDGISTGATVSNGILSCGSVSVLPGTHTVSFEIQDKLGNLAKVTRTFTIAGDKLIWIDGHNDSGKPAEYDSTYYVDIKTSDLAKIEGFTTTLHLQTANTWELEGIVAAPGYEVTTSLNVTKDLLTLNVTKVDDSYAVATLANEATIVSIPVRVWSWNGSNHVTDTPITPEAQFKTGYCPIVSIDFDVRYGSVELADGTTASFGGKVSVATNLNDNINPWHYHDAELTVLNEEATCTTAGYSGRTYCATCASVIDWGTVVPATGHTFEIVNDQLVCDCGEVVTGNGLVKANGKIYCLISDKLVTGWQAVEAGWCYAAVSTMEVQTGEFTVNKLTYTADENGIVIKGAWVTDSKGTKYSYGPAFYTREWATIEGAEYYFGTDSYMYTGIRRIPVNRNNAAEGATWHQFGEDGKLIHNFEGYEGIITSEVDGMGYVKDGKSYYAGLIYLDTDDDGEPDAYYYARTSGEIVCGRSYGITKTNGLLPARAYTFGADGKMIDPPVVEKPTEPEETTKPTEPVVKNGVCADENGKLWYYVNDVKTYGGLLYLDTDGDGEPDAYYYARTSGEIVCGRSYGITKTNGLLPARAYTFGADGKMIDPPVVEKPTEPEETTKPTEPEETTKPTEPVVKNGVCADENGKLWYYVNDVKTYGGLLYLDTDGDGEPDAYYYARTSGEIVCGRSYGITKTNGLLPARAYTFGADGKMINPPVVEKPTEPEETTKPTEPVVKNGVCADENGKLWYYVNDVKTYGGLLYLDTDGDGEPDAYYYARTSGEIVCGRSYGITKTNGLLPARAYTFGEDGKMINPPVK